MAVVKKLKYKSNVTFKEMPERLLIKYLKQVEMHPKFMLFLMFIKWIQLKIQSKSVDHLGNYSFALLLHHKNKTMESISLVWRQ